VRNAAEFGIAVDGAARIDMPRVKARKDVIVAESTRNVERWLRVTQNLTVIEGHGRF
jgi:pyruvate/2-oxoglutarate dehydrogenase complex dihydrolipoamide dehydrogenase (E3) component